MKVEFPMSLSIYSYNFCLSTVVYCVSKSSIWVYCISRSIHSYSTFAKVVSCIMYMYSDWSIEIFKLKNISIDPSECIHYLCKGSIWVYWPENGLKLSYFQIIYNFVQYTIIDQQKSIWIECTYTQRHREFNFYQTTGMQSISYRYLLPRYLRNI